MAKTRIGGVVVADGGSIRWGMLFSIIFGSGVYAYFEGVVGLLIGFREFLLTDLLGGVRSWLVTLIELEFTVAGAAAEISWWEFGRSAQSAGLFAWLLSVVAFGLVLFAVLLLVRKGVSILAG